MIDNFAPQPYPLEASADGETWRLVIGWRMRAGTSDLAPLLALDTGLTSATDTMDKPLRYRLAVPASAQRALRDDAPSPAAVVSPAVRARPARRPQAT